MVLKIKLVYLPIQVYNMTVVLHRQQHMMRNYVITVKTGNGGKNGKNRMFQLFLKL